MSDMRRREFIAALGCAAATWRLPAMAQQVKSVRRIGVLMAVENDAEGQTLRDWWSAPGVSPNIPENRMSWKQVESGCPDIVTCQKACTFRTGDRHLCGNTDGKSGLS